MQSSATVIAEGRASLVRARADGRWTLAALLLVLALSIVIRFGTEAGAPAPRFDEVFSHPVIRDILRHGWSMGTAIDFEETKGPAFIWPYAIAGELLGDSLPALRWVTIAAFVLGVIPLCALARRAGVHGPGLVGVSLLYALLPQQVMLAQLVMSEPLFVTLSLCAVWAFWWGLSGREAASSSRDRALLAVFVVGVLFVVLLHARIHAAALAAAMLLVATERLGRRAWPWWVAFALAGLSRVPLAVRWGGLVSPMYREEHQLGGGVIQWSTGVYLFAALLPLTGVFLLLPLALTPLSRLRIRVLRSLRPDRGWTGGRLRTLRVPMAAFIGGALLGLVAPPSLAPLLPTPPHLAARAPDGLERYLGPVASLWRAVEGAVGGAAGRGLAIALVACLAGLGFASLVALGQRSWRRDRAGSDWTADARLLGRLTTATLVAGIGMYMLAQSFVVDRYLVPWAMLLPILWWRWLPRCAVAVLAAVLAVAGAWWTLKWLG